jgi:AAA family ATP:ADP antiporter
MALFYLMAKTQVPHLGIVFFLWVGIFNVMVVAQFWSFANDIYTPEEGKRLFALVAFGASSGAVVGSYLPLKLIDVVGLYEMLMLACAILLLSLLITNYVDSRERNRKSEKGVSENRNSEQPEEALGKEGAFKLVFKSRYLLMIAILVMVLNWVNTTGGYILDRTVEEAAEAISSERTAQEDFIGSFFANFFTIMNTTGLLIQLFLVSRILKYFGIRIAIMILPVIALGGYFLYALYPILAVVRAAKIAENATDYSLNNTVRHALFLPTTREQKYKGKQVVDSFFHRAGDVLSALLVFVGVTWLTFDTRHFAFVNLGLVLVWLLLAIGVGRRNSKLTEGRSAAVSAEGA